jgi:hypothetical protein
MADKKPSGKVFDRIRLGIAEELQKCRDSDMRKVASSLEYAIGTFAPSEMMKDFRISDYPFIGSRYLSVRDGHVYIVAGTTSKDQKVMAYRQGFLTSCLTHRGGMAVGITSEAWLAGTMILFSLSHAAMAINSQGELAQVSAELQTRRAFPGKKFRAFRCYLKARFFPRPNSGVAE